MATGAAGTATAPHTTERGTAMQHELNDTAPCGLGDKSAMTGRFANNYFDGIRVRGIHALLFFIIMAAYFFEQFDNWNFGFVAPALAQS